MAKTDVDFKGGDLDGTILRNAASEATLERIADALEKKQKGAGDKVLDLSTRAVRNNINAICSKSII